MAKGVRGSITIIPADERRRRARANYKERRSRDLTGQQRKQKIAAWKWKYGLSPEGVHKILEDQRWTCPITGDKLTESSNVDHCHTTGKVRGILSPKANILIGMANESIETLEAAIQYLRRNRRS
jgi:hypothetical protein